MYKTSSSLSQTDWLSLSLLKGIGPARLSRLMQYLCELDAINQDQDPSLSKQADVASNELSYELLRKLKWPEVTAKQAMAYLSSGELSDEQQVKLELTQEWLTLENHTLLLFHDENYPQLLKEISVPPALLYAKGSLDGLAYPKLGVVGARRCSKYGSDMTLYFSEALADRGVSIVSGGALGIDTAAHRGALKSNGAPSISVMGTGLLHCYPDQNKPLYDALLDQGGLLLSEYPLTTQPRPNLFPPRNRIISGLSMAILVAEASIKSGSLISASYALQQNRDVFAFPGRITDSQSAGCHQLIRQGASLVTKVEDILNECPLLLESLSLEKSSELSERLNKDQINPPLLEAELTLYKHPPKPNNQNTIDAPYSLSELAKAVFYLLKDLASEDSSAVDFDALSRLTKTNAADLMQALMELELNACIENQQGLYWLVGAE